MCFSPSLIYSLSALVLEHESARGQAVQTKGGKKSTLDGCWMKDITTSHVFPLKDKW